MQEAQAGQQRDTAAAADARGFKADNQERRESDEFSIPGAEAPFPILLM